ncbi:MAG: PorP/SprF family type IX secretion system membrane protein [Sphingobacteriaceae bacterium]|nr:PorP/SprF family type IX secretion system membrane protein [Sphingobacteriaceae bacterium]
MKKIYLAIGVLIFTLSAKVKAQDIHFSQVMETPLIMSPANTGFFDGYFRASVNYRSQWAAMGNPFQTTAVSMDGGLFKSKKRKTFLGLGFVLFNDRAGAAKISRTNATLNISGILKLNKHNILSVGFNAGADATSAVYTNLSYGSQFDGNIINPEKNSGEESKYRQFTTTDIGTGVSWRYSKVKTDQDHDDVTSVMVSVGAFHINRPTQEFWAGSEYKLPVRWTNMVSARLDVEDTKFSFSPALMVNKQYQAWEYVTGTYIKFRTRTGTKTTGQKTENSIGAGLFYRSQDAFIYKIIFERADLAIGLSYDMNVSGYRTATKYFGGFEVSLRYNVLSGSLFDSRNEYK